MGDGKLRSRGAIPSLLGWRGMHARGTWILFRLAFYLRLISGFESQNQRHALGSAATERQSMSDQRLRTSGRDGLKTERRTRRQDAAQHSSFFAPYLFPAIPLPCPIPHLLRPARARKPMLLFTAQPLLPAPKLLAKGTFSKNTGDSHSTIELFH